MCDTLPPVPEFTIRSAVASDAERLVELMRELAQYEKLEQLFVCTADSLRECLFTDSPVAAADVAVVDGEIVGYAIYYRTFSTFLGRAGTWLEDLYVMPSHRGQGLGKALLRGLAGQTLRLNRGRLEWAVLDWNQPAIGFYQGIGAEVRPDWRLCRMAGDSLEGFAEDRRS